ncbi:MAG TPA: rRNA pseudouridine synthase [Firmicutes bacterium]|jgi:23S rRNA pseudouridine2605 synthase|nr:rRNA pseudouridine synthase [Bacillota bacterium]
MERLQKFMARCGVASRRQAEKMIIAGRVSVNSRVVLEPGHKIDPENDQVLVDGRHIRPEAEKVYILLHKPEGYVTTVHDPQGRPTVLDLVNRAPQLQWIRLFPVGRLDYNTTGLLLLTNDGGLAYALTHPRYQVEKTYEVLVKGVPSSDALTALRKGILLEDGLTAPAKVDIFAFKAGNAILRLVIHEGRKRQVRRMCQAIGHPVLALQRIALGPLKLGCLEPGAFRRLSGEELRLLKSIESQIVKKGEADAAGKER